MLKILTLLIGLSTLIIANAQAEITAGNSLEIDHPWIWESTQNQKTAAVFMDIKNISDKDDILLSAESESAGLIEIHEVKMQDGIMKMRNAEDGLLIKQHETTHLKPKDNHVMLFDLNVSFKAGETVPFKLKFKEAGDVEIDVIVRKRDS